MERKPYFLCLQICEAGKQTIPIPAGPVEDEGAAMGLLWPFQIKKFPRQPIFPTRNHNLKLLPRNLSCSHITDARFNMGCKMPNFGWEI